MNGIGRLRARGGWCLYLEGLMKLVVYVVLILIDMKAFTVLQSLFRFEIIA